MIPCFNLLYVYVSHFMLHIDVFGVECLSVFSSLFCLILSSMLEIVIRDIPLRFFFSLIFLLCPRFMILGSFAMILIQFNF